MLKFLTFFCFCLVLSFYSDASVRTDLSTSPLSYFIFIGSKENKIEKKRVGGKERKKLNFKNSEISEEKKS